MNDILQKIALLEEKLRKLRLKRLILLLPVAVVIALIPLIMMLFDIEQRGFYRTALDIEQAAINTCPKEDTYSLIVFGRMMENEFDFHGELPESGRIAVSEDCQVALALHDGENCAIKYFWEDEIKVDKKPHADCIIFRDIFSDNQIVRKTQEGYIPIASETDLKAIGHDQEYTFAKNELYEVTTVPSLDKNYTLTNDLDLKDSAFKTIGNIETPFSGTFDGNGFVIENYQIEVTPQSFEYFEEGVGFFASIKGATIKNFNLDVDIKGFQFVGGMAINAEDSHIINSTITGQIEARNSIGGLFHEGENLNIKQTKVDLEIKATFDKTSAVGGMIVIGKDINIENSYVIGKIDVEKEAASFIYILREGENKTTIKNSYSLVEIKNDQIFQMIMGNQNLYEIIDSYFGVAEHGYLYKNSPIRRYSDLTKKETFENWDFEEIWEFKNEFPSLQKNK